MGPWWSKLRASLAGKPASRSTSAPWRHPPASPYDYPVLDLGAITAGTIATSTDPACARLALAWGDAWGEELDPRALDDQPALPCALRYPAAYPLPEGILFAPGAMEEKWVLAYRAGRILAARSWTGEVGAVAETRREGADLVVQALRVGARGGLAAHGDPVATFDWLIRSHALGQALPLPLDEAGAAVAEASPLTLFTLFGSKAIHAATVWSPPPPTRPLRANGEFLFAVRSRDLARARTLWAQGAAIDAPGVLSGYTPLYFAVMAGELPLVQALLEWGADPNHRAEDGACPLIVGIVAKASPPILAALVAAGADPKAVNDEAYGCLHAAAELGNHEVLPWLVARGLDLGARTRNGHTALHIAAGLGHLAVVQGLVEHGAATDLDSPQGTPEAIAKLAGHKDVVKFLRGR